MSWKVIAILAGIGALMLATNLVVGCRPSVSDRIEAHEEAMRSRLAQFRRAGAAVAQHPLLKQDDVVPPATPLVFCRDGSKTCRPNAVVVQAEDLRALGEVVPLYARLPGELVPMCASIIEHRTGPWHSASHWTSPLSGEGVEDALGRCAGLQYLLVLRTVALRKPKLLLEPGYHYDGGFVAIEAHVFQLEPFEQLGAFSLEAESSSSYEGVASYLSNWLEEDIRKNLERAVRDKSTELLGASWEGG